MWLVGGPVRDFLLKRRFSDLDFLLEESVDRLARALAEKYPPARIRKFPKYLTATVETPEGPVDLAQARRETYPEPACMPEVEPAASAEEDLARRDFAIHAMAWEVTPAGLADPRQGLLDPHGGRQDLEARRIRALHPLSFRDDPCRIFRAARFSARFSFPVEPRTLSWIREAVKEEYPALLSPPRLRDELHKILLEEGRAAQTALELLEDWGALRFFHPRLRAISLPPLRESRPEERTGRRLSALLVPLGAREREGFLEKFGWPKSLRREILRP